MTDHSTCWASGYSAGYARAYRDLATDDTIARSICREKCAFFGEPPCFDGGDWPNKNCDEPGCWDEAAAVLVALAQKQE